MIRTVAQGTFVGAILGGSLGLISHHLQPNSDPRRYDFGVPVTHFAPEIVSTFPDISPLLEAAAELKQLRIRNVTRSTKTYEVIVILLDELTMMYVDLTKRSNVFVSTGVLQVKINRICKQAQDQLRLLHDIFLKHNGSKSIPSEDICAHVTKCCDDLIHNMIQSQHTHRHLREAHLQTSAYEEDAQMEREPQSEPGEDVTDPVPAITDEKDAGRDQDEHGAGGLLQTEEDNSHEEENVAEELKIEEIKETSTQPEEDANDTTENPHHHNADEPGDDREEQATLSSNGKDTSQSSTPRESRVELTPPKDVIEVSL